MSKPRVLLIDDNPAFLECLAGMLNRDFHVVGAIRDASRAIDAVAILRPDLIVMDISMPGMNGLVATRALKRVQPNVAIIALTRHDDDTYLEGLLRAGA